MSDRERQPIKNNIKQAMCTCYFVAFEMAWNVAVFCQYKYCVFYMDESNLYVIREKLLNAESK